ncbi:MAG: thioredoxin family protein, partial [Candidatus Omnitrophota bacterium]
SAEYDGRLKVCKINVDQGQATASAYNVMSIPTLIIFKQGNIAEQLVGSVSKGQLQQKIDRVLAV